MRISDWSSDVCSSDLPTQAAPVNYTVFWRMFHLVNPPDLPISLLLADDSAVWRIVRTQLAGIGAMTSNLCVVFTMATALSLAACDGKPEKSFPVGQAIASVDGMETPQRELVAERDMIGRAAA